MTLDRETISAVRHFTITYLKLTSSRSKLLAHATRVIEGGGEPWVGASLFRLWDSVINPRVSDASEVFTREEWAAIIVYDRAIRSFASTAPGCDVPLGEFVQSSEYEGIAACARTCLRSFRRFWFFYAA